MSSVSVLLVKERLHSAYYKLKMQIARGYINLEETDKTAKTDGFWRFNNSPSRLVFFRTFPGQRVFRRKARVRAVLGIYLWHVRIFISLHEYSEFSRRMITWHPNTTESRGCSTSSPPWVISWHETKETRVCTGRKKVAVVVWNRDISTYHHMVYVR
jgi:hypothetical protein